jgi:hypothetical protein
MTKLKGGGLGHYHKLRALILYQVFTWSRIGEHVPNLIQLKNPDKQCGVGGYLGIVEGSVLRDEDGMRVMWDE